MIGKRVEAGCCRRPTGAGYAVLSMPPNFGRLMLAGIGPVWTVLIGSSKDGARTFIMPCAVGVHAEKFTILGGCSLQRQGHHSPTSNYIEGPVATDNQMMAERAMSRSITRKPSCLISIHHPGPDGGCLADVGRPRQGTHTQRGHLPNYIESITRVSRFTAALSASSPGRF
jgi:hypothetical protein